MLLELNRQFRIAEGKQKLHYAIFVFILILGAVKVGFYALRTYKRQRLTILSYISYHY